MMTMTPGLLERANNRCELCGSDSNLSSYQVPPYDDGKDEHAIVVCATCQNQIENTDALDIKHWHCLNESMWSQIPAVQVMAWRLLDQLSTETWAQDLKEMLYLEDEVLQWAQTGASQQGEEAEQITVDCNGTQLLAGDTVTIIKDLDVKGAGFTAKRGTAVRNISLTSNPEHIEGRVNGTRIVLLSCYLKKAT